MPLKENRDRLHNRVVRDIARERFAYPSEKYPSFKAYVNEPEPTMGVELKDGTIGYPDIVVVDTSGNVLKIVAEVETATTVSEREAEQEWRPYADVAPLYLYVPVGYAERAKKIYKQLKIPVVGLRTWRYVVGYEAIEVVDIETVPLSPLERMLPGILLRPLQAMGLI
ncbi:MAG: hypothetical protein ACE5IZ_09815 [Dehalococcoidia bacterium]